MCLIITLTLNSVYNREREKGVRIETHDVKKNHYAFDSR